MRDPAMAMAGCYSRGICPTALGGKHFIVMTDWVKGMLRRCFGKDTFAMTVLQQGYSRAVLAEYKVQDDLEHKTQSVISRIGDIPTLGERRNNLKEQARVLKRRIETSEGAEKDKFQRMLTETTNILEKLSQLSGASQENTRIPRGIAARVASMQLPEDHRPAWLKGGKCMVEGCKKVYLMQCYLCSAFICAGHCVLVGRPQTGAQQQRLGAGHVRCSTNLDGCNKRVEYLRSLNPS